MPREATKYKVDEQEASLWLYVDRRLGSPEFFIQLHRIPGAKLKDFGPGVHVDSERATLVAQDFCIVWKGKTVPKELVPYLAPIASKQYAPSSGWFRFEPRSHRLTSFGTYHSTNPWGVTFDDWGQHMASHPIFASAFHALDPPYPQQHPKPAGLRAYSGVCGQEFINFKTFPADMQGQFIKVRYKPTNRVEIHKWNEYEFGYDEQYVGDLIFSTNLSFIPVDLRYAGYRPQFFFRTTDVTGDIKLPDGVEMVMPGDNITMEIELIVPIAIEEQLRFAVREGGRTIGAGVVTEIIE